MQQHKVDMASLWGRRALVTMVCLASAWGLLGCKTTPNQAPVEDRAASKPAPRPAPAQTDAGKVAAAAASTTPAVETRPPTYTVKPGDTLMRIGLDTGQGWRDIARWNNITDPNVIEVGQVLRVLPPPGEVTTTTTTTVTTTTLPPSAASSPGFKTLPPVAKNAASGASAATAPIASGAAVALPGAAATPQPAPRDSDDDLTWTWPASGPVVQPFDEAKTKGLSISGKAGDPVYAAADGRVVYAGSGLRGYGNLVIVKHNATYLTAYAHNQTLLVKEDQIVRRGQKIAEMGSTDTDRVQLHFEIRKQGKPIDPARLLPAR
jgi:lipoprotein NlpD